MRNRCRSVTRRLPVVDAVAPPERLAALRIATGLFALGYLLIRLPVFLELRLRADSRFDGVGLFDLTDRPLPSAVVVTLVVATIVVGVAYTSGAWFRWTGPGFALGMLILTTYRSSWGQLLHFENLMVLHLLIVGFARSADAWARDARHGIERRESTTYGFPIELAALTTVITYVIAGIAKLRYGGIDWVTGDTMRNHVAYSAARLDVLGGRPAPLAAAAVEHEWIFPPMAAGAVLIELLAPVALLGGATRTTWVATAWVMHAGILALMLVAFGYPLFLVAFAPLFKLENLVSKVPGVPRKKDLRLPTPT